MVSDRITIYLGVDTTEAESSIDAVKAKADEVTRQWKIDRALLIQQVREGFMLISQMWSSFRQGMSLFGQQIDPFFGALIGMVLSTTSMLISSATAISATVLGAPVGAILFGVAVSFNIISIAKLIADKQASDGILTNISQALSNITSGRPNQSGMGGF